MSDFDLSKKINQAIQGRRETWDFIRSFVSHWVTPLKEADGYSEADLLAAEERLGISLPAALKEAYNLFGRRSDLTRNQEYLLEPTALYLDHGALIFRHENQGAAFWGILVADLQYPDPPVYKCWVIVNNVVENWETWLGRFSLSCIDLILWESLHDSSRATEFCEIDEEELELVDQLYQEVPYPRQLAPWHIRLFTGTDLLLYYTDAGLFVRARTLEAIHSVRQNLPVDWLNE
jgi:hypothetical protein